MSYVCPNGHDSTAGDYCDTCGAQIDSSQSPGPSAPEGSTVVPPAAPSGLTCPNCTTDNVPESLFCEACGYDFTTGAMPRGTVSAEAAEGGSAGAAAEGGSAGAAAEAAQSPASEMPSAPPSGGAPDPGGRAAGEGEAGGIPDAGEARTPALTPGSGIPPAIPLEWVAEVWIDPDWYAVQEADDPMPSPGLPVVVPLTVRSALVGRVSASKNITPDIDCTTDSGVSRRHAQLTTDGTRWFVEDLGSSNGTFVGDAGDALPEDPIEVGPKRELGDDDRIYVGAWTRIVVRPATPEEKAASAE